jgi:subtilisin family serine protease
MPMRPLARRAATLLTTLALTGALLPSAAMAQPTNPAEQAVAHATPGDATKLRGDLAALVAGAANLDPRIPDLVAGHRDGELPYFVVLNRPKQASDRSTLESLGARVLRDYRSVDAFAVASSAANVLRVAALPSVAWLAPVEVVVALNGTESYGSQARGTPGDLGAPAWWDQGVTGEGVRIAILDTGIDASHPDLDDQDWRDWSNPLPHSAKVIEQRNFVGSSVDDLCPPIIGVQDGHGHGTHVAAIAAGTAEGAPAVADDNGKYAGIAPDAELVVGKALGDAGAGLNSDLIAAMEWAATPPGGPLDCGAGAEIVNMSLGTESRPGRQNTSQDGDLVSLALNRLAVQYGTLFVVAAGNSGPFIGSQLESPGSASQGLSVSATAKTYDLNHDDTYSGDNCAGYMHPSDPANFADNTCDQGDGTQPSSLSSLSSRGPSGDLWLRPDVAAPGYYIVSAQAAGAAPMEGQDINLNTRYDPLYATASGTSMAAPATAGSAAILLDAYRNRHGGQLPSGASGTPGLPSAPAYALVRAALMNTAGSDLLEARLTSKNDLSFLPHCDLPPEQIPFLCDFINILQGGGTATVYEVRNGPADPYVGPLGEGAGKVRIGPAIDALRDGVVIYSAASGSGADAGTGPRDLQGSWQVGIIAAGASQTQGFVVQAAPGTPNVGISLAFSGGNPSDGSRAIPLSGPDAWSVQVPSSLQVPAGGNEVVTFGLTVPANAAPGIYTGVVVATTSQGKTLHVPVFASVPMHDPNPGAGNAPGPQAEAALSDVFAKADTIWPSVIGSSGTGATSDWNTYAVDFAADLDRAVFTVADTAAGTNTYDLYLYDAAFNLIDSTHPFTTPGSGVTDLGANDAREPTPPSAPQVLTVEAPEAGRHYIVVNRAKIGVIGPVAAGGSFGSFALTLDEVGVPGAADLVVSNITTVQNTGAAGTNGQPKAGDKVVVRATITNRGSAPTGVNHTAFTLDGVEMAGSPVETDGIQPGAAVTVDLTWDTRGLNGDHVISVTADAGGAVSESNTANNSSTLTVSVKGNKVTDGDFEQANADGSAPEAWSGSSTGAGTTSYSSTGGSEGSSAATISGTGGSVALSGMPTWTSDPIDVTPGQVLSLRASVSSSGLSSAPAVGLAYLGPAGELLNTVRLIDVPPTTSGFTTLEQVVTLPPGVAQVRVVLLGFSPADLHTAGSVTFDDIGLFEE